MKVEVLMPKMGESITEGRILKWLKKAGDAIKRDETIAEISTDKVDTEVPAPENGVIVQLLADENDTVEVNKPIAIIETDAAAAQIIPVSAAEKKIESIPAVIKSELSEAPVQQGTDTAASHPAGGSGEKYYSPVVMRIAASEGITFDELQAIPGTGINGRVTKSDLLAYIEQKKKGVVTPRTTKQTATVEVLQTEALMEHPATNIPEGISLLQRTEIVPMDNMHRLMAEHMVKSKQISPHVTLVSEIDMTAIVQFRQSHAERFKSREGFTLTYLPMIADASIRALKDFPLVNASIVGTDIHVKKYVNLGIAVALDTGGLIVPVVKNADTLNLVGLARGINDAASRARAKRLQPEDIQDGTFTITNYGVFGNLFGTPIINQPQVAILGVGAVKKRPVVIEREGSDFIAVRSMMYLSLSFDHRLVDGALGGMYIERVVKYLEEYSVPSI